MDLTQTYHIGDVVAYKGLTYDVVKVTKTTMTLQNELRVAAIWCKDQVAKLTMIQESMSHYE